MCGKVRNLNKLAKCADKAATDEKGQINSTVWEAVEAYRTLKRQKATARKYIKAVTGCKLGSFSKLKCAGLNPLAFLLFIISLLTSRRSDRKEWWDFEALGYLEARNSAWAIEDYLWKTRWVERLIEAFITLTAFSLGGLILGAASAFLAHKRFGWASIFSLFLSVLFWGSTLEWGLFVLKAAPCFLSGTDQGLQLLKHIAQKRWKGQVSKL
jgi:ABC-type multidrug transport system fused ATPase/permease subunit